MRLLRTIPVLAALLLGVWLLAACSGAPKIDRVDVTWISLSPPPRWGLYPGYHQEIEFKPGSAYQLDVFVKGKNVTGGIVGDRHSVLAFLPTAGARDIEAQAEGPAKLSIYVTLKDEKGGTHRMLCLTVERQGDRIWFDVPK